MVLTERNVLLCLLLASSILLGSCKSDEPAEEATPSPEEKGMITVETAVADWLPSSADEIAEEVGPQVTGELPIASGIATEAIRTALLTRYELSIQHVEDAEGTDAYLTRVGISFPIRVKLPVVGEKEYLVSLTYNITVRDGQVTESRLDPSSIELKAVSG